MEKLNFDSGIINLAVNGDNDKIFSFNPTDANVYDGFFHMLNDMPAELEKMTGRAAELDVKKADMPDTEYVKAELALRKEVDTLLRARFDDTFGAGAASLLFGTQNVTSLGKNGDFIFANAIMAIFPFFEGEMKKRKRKVDGIIQDHKRKKK